MEYHVTYMRADVYASVEVTTASAGKTTTRGKTLRTGRVDFWQRDELARVR